MRYEFLRYFFVSNFLASLTFLLSFELMISILLFYQIFANLACAYAIIKENVLNKQVT